MGFDFNSRKRDLGAKGYYRANIFQMIVLRKAMVAAGVDRDLVYEKFISNDGFRVSALESRQIASSLFYWLKAKHLVLDLNERNPIARVVNKAYLEVVAELGGKEEKRIAKIFGARKSIPVNLNAGMRRTIREFSEFCERSGGSTIS
jgi:hypothetical protein